MLTPNNNDEQKTVYIKHTKKCKEKIVLNKPSKSMKLFSTNAAGVVTGKADGLNFEVKATGANIVTIQEMK